MNVNIKWHAHEKEKKVKKNQNNEKCYSDEVSEKISAK